MEALEAGGVQQRRSKGQMALFLIQRKSTLVRANEDDLGAYLQSLKTASPQTLARRFTVDRMIDDYLFHYAALLERRPQQQTAI